MNDALHMSSFQRVGDLSAKLGKLIERHGAAADAFLEGLAL